MNMIVVRCKKKNGSDIIRLFNAYEMMCAVDRLPKEDTFNKAHNAPLKNQILLLLKREYNDAAPAMVCCPQGRA
jgi:hypothetical protein